MTTPPPPPSRRKTAAFALPILHRLRETPWNGRGRRPIRSLVLTPTRELASQIAESFGEYGRHTGLEHAVVFGGVGQHPQAKALQRGIDILVATPGRLAQVVVGHPDVGEHQILHLGDGEVLGDSQEVPGLGEFRRATGRTA